MSYKDEKRFDFLTAVSVRGKSGGGDEGDYFAVLGNGVVQKETE